VQLFDRLNTWLHLTAACEVALQSVKRVLIFVEETSRAARDGATGKQGLLRIGFGGYAA